MKKEKEFDEVEEWIKKSKKLKKTYGSYEKLRNHCEKALGLTHFRLVDDPDGKMIIVEPLNYVEGGRDHDRFHGARDIPTYMYSTGMKNLVRFDPKNLVDEIAPILAEHVDRVALIKDVLVDEGPKKLQDLYERTVVRKKEGKKTKITPSDECFFLSVGGKPGAPERLFIRD